MSLEGFEVAVVGAGPAGSAAALTLAREGVQVLLVERGLSRDQRTSLEEEYTRTLSRNSLGTRGRMPLSNALCERRASHS